MTDERPVTDDRDPAQVVTAMVDHVLDLARTWTAWDGRPVTRDDRPYTPHKAIRRVVDHMIDHLAEIDARLAGVDTIPDRWHASAMTTAHDLAAFTEQDLEEAESRLGRLSLLWTLRLESLTPAQLDADDGKGWSPRELAFHLAESVYYADAIGPVP